MNNQPLLRELKGHMLRYSLIVFFALAIIYFLTGFYYVKPKQIAVQERFGKIIDGNIKPGLHYALPAPIDKVIKIEAMSVESVIVDDFASANWEYGSRAQEFIKQTSLKPYAITGDNNIVNISLFIKYNVIKPADYVRSGRDAKWLIQSLAAESLLIITSKTGVDEILISGKKALETGIGKRLQNRLDELESGIGVVFIEIREISPPKLVQNYFDDVIKAKVEKRKLLNDARTYKNRIIPEARQYANRILQEARTYKTEQTLMAQGEASRFLSKLQSVVHNKNLMMEQEYIELIKRISQKVKDIRVIDQ